jgi:hypothetical protein
MISFLTSEAGMTAISLFGGWIMRYMTEKNKLFFDTLKARDGSMDAAATRTADGGKWMRRAIYFTIAFTIVAVIFAGYVNVPVVVENEVTRGILFWKKTITEFVTVNGVLFPVEMRKAFLMLCAFYLGQGVK